MTWITGTDEFIDVGERRALESGAYCGGPSKLGVNFGPFLSGTVAVCGIEFAITASCACGVPATDRQHRARQATVGGIFAKSARQRVARDERPRTGQRRRRGTSARQAARSSCCWSCRSARRSSCSTPTGAAVPTIGTKSGWPLNTISSVGDLRRVDRRHAVGERRFRVGLRAAVEHVDGAGLGELAVADARSMPSGARLACVQGPSIAARRRASRRRRGCSTCRRAALQDQRARVDDALEARVVRARASSPAAPSIGTRIAGE